MNHELRGTCVPGCVAYGLCHCGCGQPTTVAPSNNSKKGIIKGRPAVFRFRHRQGYQPGAYTPVNGHTEKVSTAPLRRYLQRNWSPLYEADGMPYVEMQRRIAQAAGVTTRQVARWQRIVMEQDEIAVEIADAMCSGLGVPFAYVYAAGFTTSP